MVRIVYTVFCGVLLALWLVGCGSDEPVIVTEVVMVDGAEVEVTRVVQTTVEILVTPLPEIEVLPSGRDPVFLNMAVIDTREEFVLDPYQANDDNTVLLLDNLFAGLTNYNAQTGTIEPEIAGSWAISPNGLTWTFYLRPDFYWVDGRANGGEAVLPVRPVTAEDFVFAWQRGCERQTQMPDVFLLFIIEGCESLLSKTNPSDQDRTLVGVRAVEPYVLEVQLTKPANYFLAMTSMWYMRPLPREYVQNLGVEWALPENIISNGPFFWNEVSLPGTRLVLSHNPAWPLEQRGNVDVVNLFQFENRSDAYALWQEMSLDIAPLPATVDETARIALGDRVRHIPVHEIFYLGYNFDSPVFRVTEMRRAFGAAIDRMVLLDEVYGGLGFPMRHLAPPGVVGGLPLDLVGVGYSPDFARRQFSAGGFASCRAMTPVTLLTTTSDEALQQAEALQNLWRLELGCPDEQIIIEQVQFGTLLARTRQDAAANRPDMWILGWSAYYPDAYNWLNTLLHCTDSENRPDRACSEVDTVLGNAAATTALTEQAELYREAERLFFGEEGVEPITPLFMRGRYEAAHIWARYTPTPVGGAQFDTYEIDTEVRALERE